MKLAIGNDHVAVEMKKEMQAHLESKGIEVIDVGTNSTERFHYPVSGYKVAQMVAAGEVDGGVLICGTGVGISLAANKVNGIRACVCSEPYSARLSKQHNNTNIIAFGARVIGPETAKMILDEWLNAKYEGGRHQIRIDMISEIETTGKLLAAEEITG
ncbi:ribose 5-phosphate isomerase B [Pygmaiobacter massiliensis]|uniref:ribose 5-phosphate isomerase B n=1 Tax=Pygmaiobacter massiliensis TaxID=1917873 RepID=UPI000C7A9FAC|nr:ribose 5-phosphate isomerase B [Pygmaiobacter massiliensis]MDY4784593.1 ribose 5-phosphate isomerase B [Pygmaiobacter massiliensis]